MTTAQPPDAHTLQSWEDAFQHPLPVVRKLEQQLRKNIDENRQKLRSLVGASYRDLLGTAERIIDMDEQMQQAETHMGHIGRQCNARTLERMAENHARMRRNNHSRGAGAQHDRCRVVAQTKVLQSAVAVTSRTVRRGGDALLAAKSLVLARLLLKSLADGGGAEEASGGVLEELRRKLGQVRKKLLAYIARSLVQAHVEKTGTARCLAAYSLITSSAPQDVLRYFLQVRFEQLEAKAETPSAEDLLEMLDLYSRTLLDTREVFPRRFGESLTQLSKVALVRDADVRSVSELSLDVYEQWIADDVRNFHPWVRHDQVSSSEVGDALASWTKQAQHCVLEAVSEALADQKDANAVLGLRRKVLSRYLSLGARLRGESHIHAINELRSVFLTRLEELACNATAITDFDLDVQREATSQPASMWDLALHDVDLNGGAIQLREAVVTRQHGRGDATHGVIACLNSWTERLSAFQDAIAAMRATKWDDDLDLDLDDLSDDTPLQMVLSKQDPQHLESVSRRETALALESTYRKVQDATGSARNPMSLIRILREIDLRRRALGDMLDQPEAVHVDQSFITSLHEQIATHVSGDAIQYYTKRLRADVPNIGSLWDGTPPLPVQPSLGVFGFVKVLHRSMSDAGNDLWSSDAVRALKVFLNKRLRESLATENHGESKTEPPTSGHSADEAENVEEKEHAVNGELDSPEWIRKRHVQQLFDVLYLQRVLATSGDEEDKLSEAVAQVKALSEVDVTNAERLRKNAHEYWKRTYLLFGLLTVDTTS